MALKRLAVQKLTSVTATKNYKLGEIYCEAGDANGEKKYKYIEYYGTTITTAGTYSIVVPHAEGTTNLTKYSSDKVNMVVNTFGGMSGIAVGALTSTNKYGFIQIEGPSHIRDSMPAGGVVVGEYIKSTAAGADKTIEVATAATTTNDVGVFAIALTAATGTTTDPNVWLCGYSVGQ